MNRYFEESRGGIVQSMCIIFVCMYSMYVWNELLLSHFCIKSCIYHNVPSHFIGYDETPWYKDDLFGLKTLDLEKGNLYFNTTEGDHLEFPTDYLLDLVGLYFK